MPVATPPVAPVKMSVATPAVPAARMPVATPPVARRQEARRDPGRTRRTMPLAAPPVARRQDARRDPGLGWRADLGREQRRCIEDGYAVERGNDLDNGTNNITQLGAWTTPPYASTLDATTFVVASATAGAGTGRI
jgi:hypothetical protein